MALNISEGSILQSKPEFRKFMGYSTRALAEVVTCLYKARNRSYIKEEEFEKHYGEAYHIDEHDDSLQKPNLTLKLKLFYIHHPASRFHPFFISKPKRNNIA